MRVRACGICGSDRALCAEDEAGYVRYAGRIRFPLVPGHEFAGDVVDAGPEVANVRVGEPVVVDNMLPCGRCAACRSGASNQCEAVEEIGFTIPGGLAEYATVPARCCWSAQDVVARWGEARGYPLAALVEPTAVAYQGLFVEAGGVPEGCQVVVYGAGPIGLLAVALARAAGAGHVLVFKRTGDGGELAQQLGADRVFAWDDLRARGTRPAEVVRELTAGRGADLQVEAAGAFAQTIPEMLDSLAPRGTILLLGRSAQAARLELEPLVSAAGRIVGSIGHAGPRTFPPVVDLLASGRLDLWPMLRRFVRLEEAPGCLTESAWPPGKTVVQIGGTR